MTLQLKTALGSGAWRKGLMSTQPEKFALTFVDVEPIHRAFAPMAREQTFDVSEMAIVTALQAIAYGKPLLTLPVVIAARFQQRCIIKLKSSPLRPEDLAGRRIGVRAYTQTTGMWIRGILQNDYGVPAERVQWVTQEGGHLAEYNDPAWVERVPADRSLTDMLRRGEIDAAILGNDLPDDPDFVPVISDPDAAARAWYAKHAVIPINHMLMVRRDIAKANPAAIRELWHAIRSGRPPAATPDMTPVGIKANRHALETVLRYCEQQKLLPRPMRVEDIFAETIDVLGESLED
jgi:4,5-dihydroxyphthalate decarboxylase